MLYSCKKCLKKFEKKIDKCPSCGGEIKQTLTNEYKKGKKIDYKSNRCSNCGHILDINFRICPGCGKKQK